MDFYIASYLGKIYGEGFHGKTVIVSKDSGFSAIKDYWTKCAEGNYQLYLAASIEMGFVTAAGELEQIKKLKRMKQSIDINEFYQGYLSRLKIRSILNRLFAGTEYREEIAEIQSMLGESENCRSLYLKCLKRFGRKGGLFVYQNLKSSKELCLCSSVGQKKGA